MPSSVLMLLRVGFAGCFIGHGVFGLLQKRDWLVFFDQFGIGDATALALMPVVGGVDIAIGILGLVAPIRAVFLYGACWCLFTAALRPLSGQGAAEFLERAGNYGVPIAVLVLSSGRGWWTRIRETSDRSAATRVATVCAWTTALLLAGHGWLALQGKPLLQTHLAAIGGTPALVPMLGAIEMVMALVCVIRPGARLLIGVAAWKVATEGLFPLAGAPIWEFVERAGSYAAPLAGALLLHRRAAPMPAPATVSGASMVLALVLVASPALMAQTAPPVAGAPGPLTRELVNQLRDGGFVVACRHAITSHEREDRSPVDFANPQTQRVLSADGEAQARALGEELARLRIPLTQVLSSPYDRARRTAELIAGKTDIDHALSMQAGGREAELHAILTGPVAPGGNRLVVTHQGPLYSVFRSVRRGSIGEGDCLVIGPTRTNREPVALVKPGQWKDGA